MILTIDHGFNASTFAARVVASTGVDPDTEIVRNRCAQRTIRGLFVDGVGRRGWSGGGDGRSGLGGNRRGRHGGGPVALLVVSDRITPEAVAKVAKLARLSLDRRRVGRRHPPAERHARPLRRHRCARSRRRGAHDTSDAHRQRDARRRRSTMSGS